MCLWFSVTVHYTGKLSDGGKQFDSSIGGQPISFRLGAGIVIKGWEDGLIGSCKGEKAILKIPSQLGYGAKGKTTHLFCMRCFYCP